MLGQAGRRVARGAVGQVTGFVGHQTQVPGLVLAVYGWRLRPWGYDHWKMEGRDNSKGKRPESLGTLILKEKRDGN